MIFCDLTKAFDTIDHMRLIMKLSRLGASSPVLELLKSYLENRRQVFVHNGKVSSEVVVDIGVPQGSVLGPLLFIAFMNDLLKLNLGPRLISFADDTALLISGIDTWSLRKRATDCMTKVAEWMHTNGLVLNTKKKTSTCYLVARASVLLTILIDLIGENAKLSAPRATLSNTSQFKSTSDSPSRKIPNMIATLPMSEAKSKLESLFSTV